MEVLNDIIEGCKAGKNRSQRQLYEMFSRKMFGVCLHYSRDYTEAEDILQDGFVKVFSHIGSFDFKGSFEGWVRRIMINTALERYRKQNFLYPVYEIADHADELYSDDIVSDLSSKELLQMIQKLPPQYRMVFSLFAIDGYSHAEISQILGISEGTSKSNLSRARGILQNEIKKLYGTEYNAFKLAK